MIVFDAFEALERIPLVRVWKQFICQCSILFLRGKLMETTLQNTLNELQEEFNSLSISTGIQASLEQSFTYFTLSRLNSALCKNDVLFHLMEAISFIESCVDGTCLSATAAHDTIGRRALIAAAKYISSKINAEPSPILIMSIPPQSVENLDLGLANTGLVYVKRDKRPVFCRQDILDTDLLDPSCIWYVRGNINSPVLYYINKADGLKIMLSLQGATKEAFDNSTASLANGAPMPEEALTIAESHPSHQKLNNFYYINKQKKECVGIAHGSKNLTELESCVKDKKPLMAETLKEFGAELFNPLGLFMPNTLLPSEEMSIEQCLRTHIRGRDGLYLIPVSVLENLELGSNKPLLNPSYNEQHLSEMCIVLNNDELSRLEAHSELTKALFESKRQYDLLSSDTSNLLGQLRRLEMMLGLNSVYGRGAEMDAAVGAYPAIIDFISYYNCLSAQQLVQIPENLRNQINLLLRYGSDSQQNTEGTINTETCIAKRRLAIHECITGNESLLANISMSDDTKAELINKEVIKFNATKAALMKEIKDNTYCGRDQLRITLQLMRQFFVGWSIQSLNDLKLITRLSVEEIHEFLQNAELRKQIKKQLSKIDNIVLFIIDTPVEKVQVFLSCMHADIFNKVKTTSDLAALLISLESDKIEAVMNAYSQQYPAFLSNGLGKVLCYLSPVQCKALLSVCINQLPIWMDKISSICNVLNRLNQEQSAVVINFIQPQILQVCKTSRNVYDLFNKIEKKDHSLVFQVLQNILPQLCNKMKDVRNVISKLSIEQRTFVLTVIHHKLPELVVTILDVRDAVIACPPEHVHTLLNSIQDRLPRLCQKLTSVKVFSEMLTTLNGDNNDLMYNIAKNQILFLCRSMQDVIDLIPALTTKQRTEVLHALKDKFSQFNEINNTDLSILLSKLSPEHSVLLLNYLQDQLPKIFGSVEDIVKTLFIISCPQTLFFQPSQHFVAVFNTLKDQLPHIFAIAKNIRSLLFKQNSAKRDFIFNSIKNNIRLICQTAADVSDLIVCLNGDQREFVLLTLQQSLPQICDNIRDVLDIIKFLPGYHCSIVLSSIQNKIPQLCATIKNVTDLLESCLTNERNILLQALQYKLPQLCQTSQDIYALLLCLFPLQRTIAFQILKNARLVLLLQTEPKNVYKSWMKLLLPEERDELMRIVVAISNPEIDDAMHIRHFADRDGDDRESSKRPRMN